MLFRFARIATAFTAAACSSPALSGAEGAEIPAKYRGVYAFEVEGPCELPKSESDIGEFPWLVVTRDRIQGHETLCSITRVRPNVKSNVDELTFACVADGDEKPAASKEMWSLEFETKSIGGFKISQPYLSTGAGARFRKCALQGAPGN